MISLMENMSASLFAVAALMSLLQRWKTAKQCTLAEQIRALTMTIGFLLGTSGFGASDNIVGAMICLSGFVISEWEAAFMLCEKYMDLEIANE